MRGRTRNRVCACASKYFTVEQLLLTGSAADLADESARCARGLPRPLRATAGDRRGAAARRRLQRRSSGERTEVGSRGDMELLPARRRATQPGKASNAPRLAQHRGLRRGASLRRRTELIGGGDFGRQRVGRGSRAGNKLPAFVRSDERPFCRRRAINGRDSMTWPPDRRQERSAVAAGAVAKPGADV
jgi:hypothetical protein